MKGGVQSAQWGLWVIPELNRPCFMVPFLYMCVFLSTSCTRGLVGKVIMHGSWASWVTVLSGRWFTRALVYPARVFFTVSHHREQSEGFAEVLQVFPIKTHAGATPQKSPQNDRLSDATWLWDVVNRPDSHRAIQRKWTEMDFI